MCVTGQEEQYEPPQMPFDVKTYYSQEFTPKKPLAEGPIMINKRETLRVSAVPMDSRTTNKDTYKPWMQQPALAFGELPSFTGQWPACLLLFSFLLVTVVVVT